VRGCRQRPDQVSAMKVESERDLVSDVDADGAF
jgi:hypothetical protein